MRANPNRFSIGTADGSSFVRLRGVLHIDGRHFEGDGTPATSNTWLLRRVRPIVEGTFANIYDFRFTPDFAQGRTVIQDAFVTARFKPWAAVTVGKFKVPVGLERIQSAQDLRFIERGFPTSLVPNRDLGVQLGGEVGGGLVSYNVGYTNGVVDGGSTESNTTPDGESDAKGDVSARIFFQPFLNSDSFALRRPRIRRRRYLCRFDGQCLEHAADNLPYAGPGEFLHVSRVGGRGWQHACSEWNVCIGRTAASLAAVLLLLQQHRFAGRVRAGIAGRVATRRHDAEHGFAG